MKSNFDFLFFYHFVVMRGKYFNNVRFLDSGSEYSSNSIKDESWNYFLPSNCYGALNEEKVKSGKYNICLPSYLKGKSTLKSILLSAPYNYKKVAKETWFTLNKELSLPDRKNLTIEVVKTKGQQKLFLDCFKAVYNSPKSKMNAYGGLSKEYFLTLENFDFSSEETNAYMLKDNGVVVSVCLLCNFGEYVGMYGLGTRPDYSKNGYGKYLLTKLANMSIKNNKFIFFQTESNSCVEKMYKKMGFEALFSCEYLKRGK